VYPVCTQKGDQTWQNVGLADIFFAIIDETGESGFDFFSLSNPVVILLEHLQGMACDGQSPRNAVRQSRWSLEDRGEQRLADNTLVAH